MNSYDSLIKALTLIEDGKSETLTIQRLAGEAYLSESHLLRLFKLTTGQSLMDYVRGRKLAHSLKELYGSGLNVAGVALNCGFQHEQSYIRAFRSEYNCTPGKARKNKMILPIRERVELEYLKAVDRGFIYGPEIVMLPAVHLVGKPHEFRPFDYEKQGLEPNRIGLRFFVETYGQIPNVIFPQIYYAVTAALPGGIEVGIEYMPCLQVKDLSQVPKGYTGRTFPAMQCARFRYIGDHSVDEISMVTAREIYNARYNFFINQSRYRQHGSIRHFERIDLSHYDGEYCVLELMPPVIDTYKN